MYDLQYLTVDHCYHTIILYDAISNGHLIDYVYGRPSVRQMITRASYYASDFKHARLPSCLLQHMAICSSHTTQSAN